MADNSISTEFSEFRFHDGKVILYGGDCLEVIKTLPDNSIDAVVTDPPYELGFMGKAWDASGVAFCPDTWRAVFNAMKPGAHLVAFGAPKNYHRLAAAIEDAGFEIRDSLMWVFGTGFPKSMDVSKAIDKTLGVQGVYGAPKSAAHAGWIDRGRMRGEEGHEGFQRPWMQDEDAVDKAARQYEGGSDEARHWSGWGTALKPAYEPIVLARKPLSEKTVAANVLRWGTGALNIDKSRIKTEAQQRDESAYKRLSSLYSACDIHGLSESSSLYWLQHISFALRSCSSFGRDRLHSGGAQDDTENDLFLCEFVVTHLFPNGVWCGQSSTLIRGSQGDYPPYHRLSDEHVHLLEAHALKGATSLADALSHICEEQREPSHIREIGSDRLCSASVISFLFWKTLQVYLSLPNQVSRWPATICHDGSQQVLDLFPHTKSGTLTPDMNIKASTGWAGGSQANRVKNIFTSNEGSAARFFYSAKASKADRAGSRHPTVKPVALMQWLVRMITPPGGTVLDPFAGSGTTGQASIQEGFNAILIEREEEYQEDIKRRIEGVVSDFMENNK